MNILPRGPDRSELLGFFICDIFYIVFYIVITCCFMLNITYGKKMENRFSMIKPLIQAVFHGFSHGAGNGIRTRDFQLGKLTLYH